MIKLPKTSLEFGSDDITNINQDILKLAGKYLGPIDSLRSISRPVFGLSNIEGTIDYFKNLETDSERPLESRLHCFYRMVGFPVATISGKFYNPGFGPATNSKAKNNIDSEYNSSILINLVQERELEIDDIKSIFRRRDLSSVVLGLMLKFIRKFQVLNEDGNSFEKDGQKFQIKDRGEYINGFFKNNDKLDKEDVINILSIADIGSNFTGYRHRLRPFLVDPAIENTVMPVSNKIAVPFLKNIEELRTEKNGPALMRPGLELIIRERLRDSSNDNTLTLETAQKIASNEVSPSKYHEDPTYTTYNDALLAAEAVLGETTLNNSVIYDLKKITTNQFKNITYLIKTLKALVLNLKVSIDFINKAQKDINWIPLCNSDGPELGTNNAQIYRIDIKNRSNLEITISELKLKKLVTEKQSANLPDLGSFASPFEISVGDENIDEINKNLQEAVQKRDFIAAGAFEALRNIELISGEISGLGLIDVISIYIALWSMDEKALISLLDDEAFKRLKDNFPELLKDEAANRAENGSKLDINEALQTFEDTLINVLSFVDKEIQRNNVNPKDSLNQSV